MSRVSWSYVFAMFVAFMLRLAGLVTVIYVIAHFIRKWW